MAKMHAATLRVTTLVASLALALANPAAQPAPQPLITPPPILARYAAALAPRAVTAITTGEAYSSCVSRFVSLDATYPSPAPALESWFEDQGLYHVQVAADYNSVYKHCQSLTGLTVPTSLSAAYTRYTSSTSSWARSAKSQVDAIASSCGGMISAGVQILLITDAGSCSSALEGVLDQATKTTKGAAPSTENGGGARSSSLTGALNGATSTKNGAAPRATGCVVAAVAAAAVGVAGVMAV